MANITAKQVKELRDRTGAGMMDAKKALVKAEGDVEKAIDILRENGVAKAAKKSGRIAAEGLAAYAVNGNDAVLIEVNSETDFVSSNDKFINLVNSIAETILKEKPADVDAALKVAMNGSTIGDEITNLTSVIGEKITLRRFSLMTKNDDEFFGAYKHNGGAIVAVATVKGGSEEVAKNVAMHVAAINPEYLDREQVPQSELDRHTKVFTAETEKEGKPANIIPKIVAGRVNKYLSEITLVDQPYVKDSDVTVGEYAKSQNASVVAFTRFEVGEGIEKAEVDFAAEVREQMK
ncbi:MAG: translation elongation factor Ts [Lactobacillus sp.]|nr:translation elongation factor Ts [Lactobacillus sp.]